MLLPSLYFQVLPIGISVELEEAEATSQCLNLCAGTGFASNTIDRFVKYLRFIDASFIISEFILYVAFGIFELNLTVLIATEFRNLSLMKFSMFVGRFAENVFIIEMSLASVRDEPYLFLWNTISFVILAETLSSIAFTLDVSKVDER
jgi:hypothetical protein